MAEDGQDCLKKLKELREEVNWDIEKERHKFFDRFHQLASGWHGQLPNLRDVLSAEQIECLLMESCVYYTGGDEAGSNADISDDRYEEVVEFVARSGYKDELPKVVEGRPPLLRTTAIHRAGKFYHYAVRELFEIYDRYDLNYSDETTGVTHFHVACLDERCVDVVKGFLEHGQDPDCQPREEWQKDLAGVVVESPLHSALNRCNFLVSEALLRGGADPNLASSRDGSTPLHVVCSSWNVELAEMFFRVCNELGRTLSVDAPDAAGWAPLHLALLLGFKEAAELLLRNDADPNLADAEGSTPLHHVCKKDEDIWRDDAAFARMLFEISDETGRPLRLDARDGKGRTALQLAVATFLPNVVDLLLDRGADLAGFVFPTESQLDRGFREYECKLDRCRLRVISAALAIVENLERRGYELDRRDALTIATFFAKHELFEKPRDFQSPSGEEESKAKKLWIKPGLTLHDLMRLRPEEEARRVSYMDYYEFARDTEYFLQLSETCAARLGDVIARGFFRRWALNYFMELTSARRLPILCCEMIVERLMNEDLCRVCLAALQS